MAKQYLLGDHVCVHDEKMIIHVVHEFDLPLH